MQRARLAIVSSFCFFLILAGCSKQSPKTAYILATGGTSGTYYPLGNAMTDIWNNAMPSIHVTAIATGASEENLRLLSNGQAQFAIVQNDVMDYAVHGTDMFQGTTLPNINTIGTLYPEIIQIAASRSSGIQSIADLRNKRVSVGDEGSGVAFNAQHILEAYGLTFDDIVKSSRSFKDSADGIRDETLDACFVTAGIPNSALKQLALTSDIVIIPIEDTMLKKICARHPFYTTIVIPGGTYHGTNSDISALAIKATLAVNANLDEQTVYDFTKVLFAHLNDLSSASEKGKEVSAVAAITGVSVAIHPGAAKYYEDIGLSLR